MGLGYGLFAIGAVLCIALIFLFAAVIVGWMWVEQKWKAWRGKGGEGKVSAVQAHKKG